MNAVSRYLLALAALIAAVALRWALDPILFDLVPLITIYGAVAFAVWIGGWRPAMMVAVLGFLACSILFVEPRGTITALNSRTLAAGIGFILSAGLIIVLGEGMRRARIRSVLAASDAQRIASELATKSRQLETYLETAAVGLHRVGPDGTILWANQAELDLLGYERDEYIGHNIVEFHADREVIDDILARLGRDERIVDYEVRLKCKDGSIRTVLVDSSVYREDDRFIHTQCFTRDITEHKLAEQTRARLAAIIESSDDAIISKNLDGIITSWNTGAERLFGYSADEAVGQSITMLIPHERIDEVSAILSRIRQGDRITHYETQRRRKDGSLVQISLTVSPILSSDGRVIGASKIARDITERHRAREALRESEMRLRLITDAAPALISYVDANSCYQFANKSYENWFGVGAHDICGRHMREVLGEKAFERIGPHVRKALAGERTHFENEVPYRSGGSRVVHAEYVPDIRPDGSVAGFYAMVIDVTQRKQFEELLTVRARQQHALASIGEYALGHHELQEVFDLATSSVAQTLDVEYCKVLELLPGGVELLLRSGVGWQEGLVGSAKVDTGSDSQAGFTLQSDAAIIVQDLTQETRFKGPALLREHGVISGMSCIIRRPDGRPWGVLGTHAKRRVDFTHDDVSFLVAVASTLGSAIDRKFAEQKLARHAQELAEAVQRTREELLELHERQRTSERFVAMGALAAGLGHDMSNLLLPIQARLEHLRSEIATERASESISAIEASVAYLRNLARSLRLLAQDAATAPADSMTNLGRWWSEAHPLLKAVLPRRVNLEAEIEETCIVRASPHQLTQLVYNLVQNAGEALSDQPHGVVTVRALVAPPPSIEELPSGVRGAVLLSVSDNGPGMSDEVKRRCMEPFFSTKQKSLSGGMGLSLVRAIVDTVHGRIDIQSTMGEGTTFTVMLPASARSGDAIEQRRGELCTAAVTIADQRTRAMVEWMLRAEGIASVPASESPRDSASIWVVDGAHEQEAILFANSAEPRHAIVLAPRPEIGSSAGVCYVGQRPTPNELRQAVALALSSFLHAEPSP